MKVRINNIVREIKNIPASFKADEYTGTQTGILVGVVIVAIFLALFIGVNHSVLNN